MQSGEPEKYHEYLGFSSSGGATRPQAHGHQKQQPKGLVFEHSCAKDRVQKKHASREILKRRDENSGFRVLCVSNHHKPVGRVYRERTPRVLAARLRQKKLRTRSRNPRLGVFVGAAQTSENWMR